LTGHRTPPKARATFRIGVVGHRPNRLPEDAARLNALRTTLRDILEYAKASVGEVAGMPGRSLYNSEPPVLRAISPLAEGSDRIFAELALALGYELCSPLPFAQAEFEKDFGPPHALEKESLEHFRALLKQAQGGHNLTLFELDGARDRATDAYAAAGRVVLNQSDLLIAVWDGGAPAGPGGTVHTIYEAMRYHLPVIWIDAQAPQNWQLVSAPTDITSDAEGRFRPAARQKSLQEVVSHIVQTELHLPRAQKIPPHHYFTKRKPAINLAVVWKIFRDLVGGHGLRRPGLVVTDFECRDEDGWSGNAKDRESAVSRWVHSRLWPHFAWADGLADLYADANRTAFLLSYLLAAAAVFLALLPMAIGNRTGETICGGLELIFLGGILGLLWATRHFHWHEHWMECRLLAELIRQLRILIPLGGARPLPRLPAHLAVYGDPSQTWMYWHMRAVARSCGIPSVKVTPDYIGDYLDFLGSVVGHSKSGQWGFHAQSAERSRVIFNKLRHATLWLLGATVLGVGARLFLPFTPGWERCLLLASAVLPALGAALEGINNQGEFTRTAHRSAAMAGAFEAYAAQVHKLREQKDITLAPVTALSSQITQTMVDEITDWRAVFSDRAQ
jgi:hypothetical protein